jgi:hypothetical protein
MFSGNLQNNCFAQSKIQNGALTFENHYISQKHEVNTSNQFNLSDHQDSNLAPDTDNFEIIGLSNGDSIPANLENTSRKGKSSLLIKVAVEALLNKYDDVTKPPFFDAAIRYQYKIGFYEFGIGPEIWYCPGNEYFMNMAVGVFSLCNNFYVSEKGKSSTFIFVEVGKEIYYHDFEDGYTETAIFDGGNALMTLGLGLKFGNKKKSSLEIGIRESFYGFFEEWDQTFAHVGFGYAF